MSVAAVPGLQSPYKGLAPFEDSEQDALLFFGRERECEVVVANLVASKLTVLYGPSGVGKSSMLKAAVVRRLRELEPDADAVVLDAWAGEPDLPRPEGDAYLILDQFEEYFLYHGDGPVLDELPELLALPGVHVLISLRDDSLARLDALQARVPNVFGNRLRIDHLDRAAARAAIVGPIDRWNEIVPPEARAGIEAALVTRILDEVAAAPGGNGSDAAGLIEAPYLQLVLERIWEEEHAAGSSYLRVGTLERLGGAGAIVSAHLERTLGTLSPHDAAIAAGALTYLVTPSRTKIAQSFDDLVGYTNESPAELRDVLELLAAQRILRVASANGAAAGRRYEIFHDVLADPVLSWRRAFLAEAALEAERETSSRRNRRLLVITLGAGIVAAAMVALAAYAISQRNEASQQQKRAEQQTAIARHAAKRAQQSANDAQQAEQKEQQEASSADASAATAKNQTEVAQQQTQVAQQQTQVAKESQATTAAALATEKVLRRRADSSSSRAKRQTRLARAAEQSTRAGELAEEARSSADPVRAVELALEARAREASALTEDVLRSSVVADRIRAVMSGGGGVVRTSVFSPDGSRVVSLADSGGARLFRPDGTLVRRLGAGDPTAVAFSPDGSVAATAGADGVRLWNAKDGTQLRRLSSSRAGPALSSAAALAVTFSADGRRIAAGGPGGATVWSADGTQLASFPHDGKVTSVALDSSGARLVTVATDSAGRQQARVFEVAGASLDYLLPERGLTSATFSPDGAWVATTSNDKTERIWDAATGTQHASWTADGHLVRAEFSQNGKLVVAANDAGGGVVSTVPDLTLQAQLLGPTNKVEDASFSPDGQFAVIASLDGTARVFRTADGFQVAVLAGNHGGVTDARWGGTSMIAVSSEDGSTRIVAPGVEPLLGLLGRHTAAVNSVHVSLDGSLAVSAGADKTARIWHVHGGGPSLVLQHDGPVEDAIFSPDGSLVLTGSDDGTARLWRASTGTSLSVLSVGSPVRAVAFSPDGRTVATAAADGSAAIWRVAGGVGVHALPASSEPLDAVAYSHDGTIVATAGDDGVVRLWDAATGALRHTLPGHTAAVTSLDFSRDDLRLVSASKDDTARLWSVATGKPIATLTGHTAAVNDAKFSPDGRLIVTASADDDLRLWNGTTGRFLKTLRGHFGSVSTGAFSPDGRWIVSGGPTTVGLWSAKTGRLFSPTNSADPYLRGPTLPVTAVVFGPKGREIVAGSADGSVRAYDCAACADAPGLVRQGHALLRMSRSR
jgi:WD40 repeat protein